MKDLRCVALSASALPRFGPPLKEGVNRLCGANPAPQVPGQPVSKEQRGEPVGEGRVEEQRFAVRAVRGAPDEMRSGDVAAWVGAALDEQPSFEQRRDVIWLVL
jgi:hypothetical protein